MEQEMISSSEGYNSSDNSNLQKLHSFLTSAVYTSVKCINTLTNSQSKFQFQEQKQFYRECFTKLDYLLRITKFH